MKYLFSGFLIFCSMMMGAIELHACAGAPIQGEPKSKTSAGEVEKNSMSTMPTMRVEDPDGTLRPLEDDFMPNSRMRMEELKEVPDAGGGSMVNVEGQLKSILQLPEGSDEAVHGHTSGNSQSSKP